MKKIALSAVGLLLSVLTAINPAVAASADSTSYDYSRIGSGYVTVGAVELLESALGETLGEVERAYLGQYSDLYLKYDNNIDSSYISADYDGSINVAAREYSYTANNGKSVVWTPVSVNGVPFTCDNLHYSATVEGVEGGEDFVKVAYGTLFCIDKTTLNGALNAAYYAALDAADAVAAGEADYREKCVKYEQEVALYENYLADDAQYQSDLAAYKNYLAQYSLWQADYEEYTDYLADYAEYERKLEIYNGYGEAYSRYLAELADYNAYLDALEQYEQNYAKYLQTANLEKVATVRGQLAALGFMTTEVNGRSLKSAITGSTVTQVLENKDVLVEKLGVNEKVVDLAGTATENLRSLIAAYSDCLTEEARYGFYITCYDQLVKNFEDLLRSLDYLYGNKMVHNLIANENKTEKFRILLAQLFVICNALDDNPVGNYYKVYTFDKTNAGYYDSSWRIDGLTPLQIIGEEAYLDDNGNAQPLEDGYPADMNEPVKPEEVARPDPPEKINCPTPPAEVENPGDAPASVSEPTAPDYVSPPGEEPQPYNPTDEQSALAGALADGILTLRKEFSEDYMYPAEASAIKYFRNIPEITVSFYADLSSETPLQTTIIENGTFVEFTGKIPEMTETGYTCVFDYWTDADGVRVNTDNLYSEKEFVSLYPHYSLTPNLYPVTWVIEGVEATCYFPYGELPVYNGGTPQKESVGARLYRFSSWDSAITSVTENGARYVALFEAGIVVTWSYRDGAEYDCVWRGETPEYTGEISAYSDNKYYYEFSRWDKEIAPAEEDVVYTAVYNAYPLFSADGDVASISYDEGYYSVNCRNFSSDTYCISRLLYLSAGNSSVEGLAECGIIIERNDSSLTFPQKAVYAMYKAGVESITVKIAQTGANSYKYYVTFSDASGESLSPDCKFAFAASGVFDTAYSRLYGAYTGGDTEVVCTLSPNRVSFTMDGGVVYNLFPQYAISVIPSSYVEISCGVSLSAAGEIVNIYLGETPVGIKIGGLYFMDAEGNRVTITDNSFRMPSCDVAVGVVCSLEEYTVTFISDGKILSVRTYNYGDEIVPPSDPLKMSDGEYVYTFAGWSQEVGTASGDAQFTALFSAEPVPEKQETGPSRLLIIINVVTGCAVAIVAIAAVAIVVAVIRARRRRKKRGGV